MGSERRRGRVRRRELTASEHEQRTRGGAPCRAFAKDGPPQGPVPAANRHSGSRSRVAAEQAAPKPRGAWLPSLQGSNYRDSLQLQKRLGRMSKAQSTISLGGIRGAFPPYGRRTAMCRRPPRSRCSRCSAAVNPAVISLIRDKKPNFSNMLFIRRGCRKSSGISGIASNSPSRIELAQ